MPHRVCTVRLRTVQSTVRDVGKDRGLYLIHLCTGLINPVREGPVPEPPQVDLSVRHEGPHVDRRSDGRDLRRLDSDLIAPQPPC